MYLTTATMDLTQRTRIGDDYSFIIFFSVVLLQMAGLPWFLKPPVSTWSHKAAGCIWKSQPLSMQSGFLLTFLLTRWAPAAVTNTMPTSETEQADPPQALWLCARTRWLSRIGFCLVLSLVFKGASPNARRPLLFCSLLRHLPTVNHEVLSCGLSSEVMLQGRLGSSVS